MRAISSRSQYAPAVSATYFAPSVKRTLECRACRYQCSEPVKLWRAALVRVEGCVIGFSLFCCGRPRLSRPDVVGRAGAEAGEGKHNRCANGAYERSELAQSCLAVLAGTGGPATPRCLRTRAGD